MAEDRRAIWDARHAAADDVGQVAGILLDHAELVPTRGRALDLACGRGGSALWLAERGLAVSAWDFSAVAIARLQAAAAARGVSVDARVRDLLAEPPEPASYDLILVSHFLERPLCPAIGAALRPGGTLFYQTFGPWQDGAPGPGNPAFRLAENELPALFAGLEVLRYEQVDGTARLVARKS